MKFNLRELPDLIGRAKDVLRYCTFSFNERLSFSMGGKVNDEQLERYVVSRIALMKFGAISSRENPFAEVRGDRGKALKCAFEKTEIFSEKKKSYSKDEFVEHCNIFLNAYYSELAALKESRSMSRSAKPSKDLA